MGKSQDKAQADLRSAQVALWEQELALLEAQEAAGAYEGPTYIHSVKGAVPVPEYAQERADHWLAVKADAEAKVAKCKGRRAKKIQVLRDRLKKVS